jgi:hypothetical protein
VRLSSSRKSGPRSHRLSIELIEDRDGPATFGGKGVGEITAIPTTAALAKAVEDAVEVRVTDLPITAEVGDKSGRKDRGSRGGHAGYAMTSPCTASIDARRSRW